MKLKVIAQHYDLAPGTIVYKLGMSLPEAAQTGVDHYLVSLTEGFKGDGDLRTIPVTKTEPAQ